MCSEKPGLDRKFILDARRLHFWGLALRMAMALSFFFAALALCLFVMSPPCLSSLFAVFLPDFLYGLDAGGPACLLVSLLVSSLSIFAILRILGLSHPRLRKARFFFLSCLGHHGDDPAPRTLLSHWEKIGVRKSILQRAFVCWLDWTGEERILDSIMGENPSSPREAAPAWLFPELKAFYDWRTREEAGMDMSLCLAHRTYVYGLRYKAFRHINSMNVPVPEVIKGPDCPLLRHPDSEHPCFREGLALASLKKLCTNDEVISLRMNIPGLDRQEVLHRRAEARALWKRLNTGRRVQSPRQSDPILEFQNRRKQMFPVNYNLVASDSGREIVEARLDDLDALMFIHGLLFFFHHCPWRWTPLDLRVSLEMKDCRRIPVRFLFLPGKEIRLEKQP